MHPKSKPFIDHVLTFSLVDGRIWVRNYQIIEEDDKKSALEIGPRFVMNPIKVVSGGFSGTVMWENPHFVSPNVVCKLNRATLTLRYVPTRDTLKMALMSLVNNTPRREKKGKKRDKSLQMCWTTYFKGKLLKTVKKATEPYFTHSLSIN